MRQRIALSVLLLLLAAVTIPAASGVAQSGQPAAAQQPAGVRADFNQDGFADLAIGVPGEDAAAGAISVLYGSAAGLTASGGQLFTQDSPGVPDTAEGDDFFGWALTASGPGASPAAASTPGSTATRPSASSR